MCDQQNLRSAFAYKQSDQSLCLSLEYPMTIKLLAEQYLEFLSLKGGCSGSSYSTLVKMPLCWKLHVTALINLTGRAPATETTSSHKKANTEINEPKPQEEKMDVSINLTKVTVRNANPESMDSFAPSDCTFNAPANLASFVFKPLSPASAASFLYPNQDTCSSFLDTIPNR